MIMRDLQPIITSVNSIIQDIKYSNPERQKKIQELQVAMQKVKDLVDGMEECQA